MILQSCIVPDEICSASEIYYRSSEKFHTDKNNILLKAGDELNSNTYMNLFDVGAWRKYTNIKKIHFCCHVEGKGTIALIHQEKNIKRKIKEIIYGSKEGQNQEEAEKSAISIELSENIQNGMMYFMLKAEDETRLHSAEFWTDDMPDNRVSLSLVICTYKRKAYVEKNIRKLKNSSVLQKLEKEKRFVVRVVDNARELSDSYGPGIRIYPNENTGGSGGFARGMEESVREREKYQTSHVVLMDDDVELQTESLSRLYAFLSYMRMEYRKEAVAGRMFRLDRREVQYTAAEIWNGGDIRHIGWNQDMTREENLSDMNENKGAEYSGWWFACYPIDFVEKNRPLPFFLHCDDVEYGLRHGGTPIILNGIQVWHETYEYRQSPMMVYYDMRNMLFVNKLYRENIDILNLWLQIISLYHKRGDYNSERAAIYGMRDFLKDIDWLYRVDVKKLHKKRSRIGSKKFLKIINSLLWRDVKRLYIIKEKKNEICC